MLNDLSFTQTRVHIYALIHACMSIRSYTSLCTPTHPSIQAQLKQTFVPTHNILSASKMKL